MRRRDVNRAVILLSILLPCAARAERSFLGGKTFGLPRYGIHLALGDWDGDGLLDVAVIHPNDLVTVLRGDGVTLLGGLHSYEVGRAPIFIASADFDGSGRPDLLTVNSSTHSISALLNNGDGTFLEARESIIGFPILQAALGDFDRDGKVDAVVSEVLSSANGGLVVMLGEGDGRFRKGVSVNTGDNPHSLVVDDFDGDGLEDAAVAHTEGISFLRSKGDGSFHPRTETALSHLRLNPRALVGGDFDGDGGTDLFAFGDGQTLLFLRNAGRGAFEPAVVPNPGEVLPFTPALGAVDFTGDGFLDVFAGAGRTDSLGVRIHPGRGDGTFIPHQDLFLAVALGAAGIADLDGDGLPDLVGLRIDSADLVVFQGTRKGEIARPLEVSLPPGIPRDLVSIDLGGDGLADLAAVESSSVHLIRSGATGQGPETLRFPGSAIQAAAAGDFDGDGLQDLALSDLVAPRVMLALLDRSGAVARTVDLAVPGIPHRLAAGDFDRDGSVDLAVTDQTSPEVSVFRSPAAAAPPARLALLSGPVQSAVAAADLDGDGAEDLAVTSRTGISVFFGGDTGALERSLAIAEGANGAALRAGDVDSDGAADLLAAAGNELLLFRGLVGPGEPSLETLQFAFWPRALALLPSRPGEPPRIVLAGRNTLAEMVALRGGGFSPLELYPLGYLVRAMALADVDGDSRLDCAIAGLGRSISVLRGADRGSEERLRRGDANQDGTVLLTDAIRVLDRLFRGADPVPCPDAADADDDGALTITDAVFILIHLFQGGPQPPSPGPGTCGPDPTPDGLERCLVPCAGT